MDNLNDEIFKLHHEGVSAGKIAQKLRVKKTIVQDVLGDAAKSKGLGDVIESITEATGIKAAVEAITDDCGCAARKEKLNKLFPTRNLNDLTMDDFDYLTEFFKVKKSSVGSKEQAMLVGIYNRVFNAKRQISNCSPCLAGLVNELKKIYLEANS